MAVSLLMLTYNDIQDFAIRNLELTKNFVDEQIVIDSSNKENKRLLNTYSKTNKKLKVYSVVALGIPETTIPFGVTKSSNDTIVLLDADEIPNIKFLKFLKRAVLENDAYYITRYEYPDKRFATKQLRLFRKGHLDWIGVPHEKVKVNGRVGVLPTDLYLIHQKTDVPREYRNDSHYKLMEKVALFTNESRLRRLVATAYITLRMNPSKLFINLKTCIEETKRTSEQKEIANVIRDKGIIKYLGLDKPGELERLTKIYRNKQQGPQLLIDLIYQKHTLDKITSGNTKIDL